jgi:hypothetical protein
MAKTNKKKSLIEEGDLDPKNAKVRITTFLDGDVLLALRKKADEKGMPYQTMLNDILRATVLESASYDAKRLMAMADKINSDVEQLKKEIDASGVKKKTKKAA